MSQTFAMDLAAKTVVLGSFFSVPPSRFEHLFASLAGDPNGLGHSTQDVAIGPRPTAASVSRPGGSVPLRVDPQPHRADHRDGLSDAPAAFSSPGRGSSFRTSSGCTGTRRAERGRARCRRCSPSRSWSGSSGRRRSRSRGRSNVGWPTRRIRDEVRSTRPSQSRRSSTHSRIRRSSHSSWSHSRIRRSMTTHRTSRPGPAIPS